MNAFETVDRGLVYIDCTGSVWSFDGFDKIATINSDGVIELAPLWPEDKDKYEQIYFGQA